MQERRNERRGEERRTERETVHTATVYTPKPALLVLLLL
jgi:hypothetical protein